RKLRELRRRRWQRWHRWQRGQLRYRKPGGRRWRRRGGRGGGGGLLLWGGGGGAASYCGAGVDGGCGEGFGVPVAGLPGRRRAGDGRLVRLETVSGLAWR